MATMAVIFLVRLFKRLERDFTHPKYQTESPTE